MREIIPVIIAGIVAIIVMLFMVNHINNKGEEYKVNNIELVAFEPAPETTSSILLVFKKGKQTYKLYTHEDKQNLFTIGNRYDVKYLMDGFSYPHDFILLEAIPK